MINFFSCEDIMISLHKFLKGSSQFKNLASNLFNNNFVLDHFAYRSFNIESVIEKYPHYKRETGEKNIYKFPNNVSATWLSKKDYPSIFVSQYDKISDDTEIKNVIDTEILEQYINNNTPPDYEIYKKIYDHNQYLGWTLLFRNRINHVAFLVNNIEEYCEKIKRDFPEHTLTNPDNPIQVSRDKNLLQFAIKAQKVEYKFRDGTFKVPFSFIEFVERKNGRTGFEGENASKIFDSTKDI